MKKFFLEFKKYRKVTNEGDKSQASFTYMLLERSDVIQIIAAVIHEIYHLVKLIIIRELNDYFSVTGRIK